MKLHEDSFTKARQEIIEITMQDIIDNYDNDNRNSGDTNKFSGQICDDSFDRDVELKFQAAVKKG